MLDVKVGDTVKRTIGNTVFMTLKVTAVTEQRIICSAWEFDKNTGGEIDEDLGWDGVTVTGSIIHPATDSA